MLAGKIHGVLFCFMKCNTKNRALAGLSLVFLISRLINVLK